MARIRSIKHEKVLVMREWLEGNNCKSLQLRYCELVLYQKVNAEYFACINNNNTNILSLRTYDEIDAKYEAIKKFEDWIMEDIEKKKKTLLELRNLRWTNKVLKSEIL